MKNSLIFSVFITTLLLLTSCVLSGSESVEPRNREGKNSALIETSDYHVSSYVPGYTPITPSVSDFNKLKSEVDKKTDAVKQISEIKDVKPFEKFKKYMFYHTDPLQSSRPPSLFDIEKEFGLEGVRQLEDQRLYTVYKTDNGGLFYFWFFPLGNKLEYGNAFLSHTAFVQKPLQNKDFSKIIEGSKVSEVTQIDPATASFSAGFSDYKDSYIPKSSRHLLSDGLLFIEYEQNQKGEYIVKEKNYYPDFEYTIDYGELPILVKYNYTVYLEDYMK